MTSPSIASRPALDLSALGRGRTILLSTFRRDGRGVGTPVHVAIDDGHAYFRTWHTAGKMKRIRNNPQVTLAPCTVAGRPTGPATRAQVRVLDGEEARAAARALARRYPILHSWLIPLAHRLTGKRTVHLELLQESSSSMT